MNVEQFMEGEPAGETEVVGEILRSVTFVRHKFHMT
jgi:hypothetical protein